MIPSSNHTPRSLRLRFRGSASQKGTRKPAFIAVRVKTRAVRGSRHTSRVDNLSAASQATFSRPGADLRPAPSHRPWGPCSTGRGHLRTRVPRRQRAAARLRSRPRVPSRKTARRTHAQGWPSWLCRAVGAPPRRLLCAPVVAVPGGRGARRRAEEMRGATERCYKQAYKEHVRTHHDHTTTTNATRAPPIPQTPRPVHSPRNSALRALGARFARSRLRATKVHTGSPLLQQKPWRIYHALGQRQIATYRYAIANPCITCSHCCTSMSLYLYTSIPL